MVHPDTINYGCVLQNSETDREFFIYNVGDEPLEIISVSGASGSVLPTWPDLPISPGDSAIFKISYNTGNIGLFNKSINLNTNEDTIRKIRIIGEIKMSTSIKNKQNNKFSLQFNNNFISIESRNGLDLNNVKLYLIDSYGSIFRKAKINIPIRIPINDLPRGIYFLILKQNKIEREVAKFFHK